MSHRTDTTIMLDYDASNVDGTPASVANASVEQSNTENHCQRTTRPRTLPNRLANLKGAKEHFIVNGEKWVDNPTSASQKPKKQPTAQPHSAPSVRPILPALHNTVQGVPLVGQSEEASLNPHNTPLDQGPSTGTFHFSTNIHDPLDSGSAISLETYAHIEAYMPPPSQSSSRMAPRDFASVQNRPATNSVHFCAQPHNHYRPQAVALKMPAATPDLSFDPYSASQLPVPRQSAYEVVPQMTASDSYQMDWESSANAVDGAHPVHLMAQLHSGPLDAGMLGSQPQLQSILEAWDDFVQGPHAIAMER
ncbi:hypothetical protein BJ165DRAFT_1605937 [Panaeolus papilionaceus]|nr:hypothetical protein BJ165DRAFT_1605937 [Panaeolus papilionaceus]